MFCFCFLLGITTASLSEKFISLWFGLGAISMALVASYLWKESLGVRLIVISILFFACGFLRYQITFPPDTADYIHVYTENEISFTGFVSGEPDIRLDGIRYKVRAEKLNEEDRNIKGEVYVKSDLYPRYRYGEELVIKCTIEPAEPIEDTENGTTFRYDRFLSRMNIYAICGNPHIESTGIVKGNIFYQNIFSFKSLLADKVSHLWHEPYASFVAGLLYGYRGGLGSLNDLFAKTGVTHIVAISGYNITVIATIFVSISKFLYIPRKKAFLLIVTGIIVFVIFTGASASVVRAGIMGILVLIAKQTGRRSSIANVLILTAVGMSIENPFVLMWDAGFQLSFLSTLGLVYIAPIIARYLKKVPEWWGIKESLISTLSAITSTLPLILFQFGRLSVVSPLVNILILWLIPWIMIAGTVAVVAGCVFIPAGRMVGFIAYAGMEYIIRIVRFFAQVRFASIEVRIPIYMMVAMYAVLVYYVGRMQKIKKI